MGDLRHRCNGRWYGILSQWIDRKYLRNVHGPCPLCGGEDRYRWDDRGGTGAYYCNMCGWGDGFDLLMKHEGWEFQEAAKEIEKIIGECKVMTQQQNKPDAKDALTRLVKNSGPAQNAGPVVKYFNRRGLNHVPAMLRFIPSMPYWEKTAEGDPKKMGNFPAMLALVVDSQKRGITFHVTYLTQEGTKAPVASCKKVKPGVRPLPGGAIRLYPLEGEELAITEGIETAQAVREMMEEKKNTVPVWSALNAEMLAAFDPPPEVKRIFIFGDNDNTFAGQAAAYKLAYRMHARGIKTDVYIPPKIGDWLDIHYEIQHETKGDPAQSA